MNRISTSIPGRDGDTLDDLVARTLAITGRVHRQ